MHLFITLPNTVTFIIIGMYILPEDGHIVRNVANKKKI